MAVILCKIHGKQGCTSTSPDFATAVIEQIEFNGDLVALELNFMGEKFITWVDIKFMKKTHIHLVSGESKISVTDENLAFDIFLKLSVICGKCFNEYFQQYELVLRR